jgi:hypothetical protein
MEDVVVATEHPVGFMCDEAPVDFTRHVKEFLKCCVLSSW